MDNTKLWSKVTHQLTNKLSPTAVKTWFAKCNIAEINDLGSKNKIIIGCANNFCLEQIKARYLNQLKEAFKETTEKECELEFRVEKVKRDHQSNSEEPLFITSINSEHLKNSEGLNLNHKFENFVVGSSNNLAYAAAKAVATDPGKGYNPLFIYGGVGVGKTHLMQAIGNAITDRTDLKVIYTTCERFTNEFIESLTNHQIHKFRTKYRKIDVLLIDDVQFLSGKESTQEEFFHTFNELHVNQKQIVLTSDRHPTEIGRLEERLVSRFLGGLTVDIGQPDFEMRVAILKTKCAYKGIELEDSVINFLASQVITNTRELEGALIKLVSTAAIRGENASVEIAKELLWKESSKNSKKISGKQVVLAVAKHFNLKTQEITGPKRSANLVKPRQIVMYLLRNELGLGLVEIGQLLGNRDHTTIMYGVEKIANQLVNDRNLRRELSEIKQLIF